MQTLETLPFIGGDPALDFVNTAEERAHPEADDVLRAPADLRRWGQRYGLLGSRVRVDRVELRRAIQARELLYRLFLARATGQTLPAGELAAVGDLAASAFHAAALEPAADGTIGWRWPSSELSTIRHVVVTSAVGLLTSVSGTRLKQCPGEHCGWFFLDTTKRGNRRWCSMSECGQDAKVARRRARTEIRG
jgi:predicted RNA-binding Zn ribbon-like protein